MRTTSVVLVGGARPNFMKLAPLYHSLKQRSTFDVTLVHTGQHYDDRMSGSFFRDLGLPEPGISLGVGSGTHAVQTAKILARFESELARCEPDLVVVVGDVNSTIACALAASKMLYKDGRRPRVAHVEAGLRSLDRTMPEEVNRVLTDSISDLLFVTEQSGVDNLLLEGRPADSIFLVGNVMIDSLLAQRTKAQRREAWRSFGLAPREYGVATLHRPSNVDDDQQLVGLFEALRSAATKLPIVFPVHPRTRSRLNDLGLDGGDRLVLCQPQPYVEFLSLLFDARLVLTDSGGIQEETTVLGVPCLTLRDSTERPITVESGTNRLIGANPEAIGPAVDEVLRAPVPSAPLVPLWDGSASDRIVEILEYVFFGIAAPSLESREAALTSH